MNIKLFNKENIHNLKWSSFENGDIYKDYLLPFIQNGVSAFIKNVDTSFLILTVDNLILPITINNEEYDNSYVCSPYTHYCTYASEETNIIKNNVLRNFAKTAIKVISSFFKYCKINKTIIVNNWLVSTNLYLCLSDKQIKDITSFLINLYPNHSIIFRSINNYQNNSLFEDFKKSDYQLVVSRQVYFYNSELEQSFSASTKKDLAKDRKLFNKNQYISSNTELLNENDILRLKELYNQLYIDKYSTLNPQYTEEFLKLCTDTNFIKIKLLKKESTINGFIGYYVMNDMMTTPLMGYDTTMSQKEGLYRMLSTLSLDEAQKLNIVINQSSGASDFKRQRGALPEIEYNAVYTRHLPLRQRMIWNILKLLLNKIGIYLLQKYKL